MRDVLASMNIIRHKLLLLNMTPSRHCTIIEECSRYEPICFLGPDHVLTQTRSKLRLVETVVSRHIHAGPLQSLWLCLNHADEIDRAMRDMLLIRTTVDVRLRVHNQSLL